MKKLIYSLRERGGRDGVSVSARLSGSRRLRRGDAPAPCRPWAACLPPAELRQLFPMTERPTCACPPRGAAPRSGLKSTMLR